MELTMYFKVIKNQKVIDVLERIVYLKYQPKHGIMITCGEPEAQAILSSDQTAVWHLPSLLPLPPQCGYDTVTLTEIDRYEYERLKLLNYKTAEEIIDAYTELLLNGGII